LHAREGCHCMPCCLVLLLLLHHVATPTMHPSMPAAHAQRQFVSSATATHITCALSGTHLIVNDLALKSSNHNSQQLPHVCQAANMCCRDKPKYSVTKVMLKSGFCVATAQVRFHLIKVVPQSHACNSKLKLENNTSCPGSTVLDAISTGVLCLKPKVPSCSAPAAS
jgi:hypothetical protein